MNLSNQPPKGTADWLPSEFAIRKYIFDTWREVCTRFGYEEYLTPIIESAEIYRVKSGEDVGGKELMTMFDRAEREYAIRPEMTPSVTRMVSKIYNDTPKPIRLFSIANYFRNEKPQRGRNREFWQLNFDIFGSDSINADVEIIQMAIEIMKAFGAS
ncbi:ATP phosphoribosyltransferase regulatory subunit, partial [Candidatus Dojkabacteria bacterium]|nr:ATP phosphoribosyltransferase regulatory subunit [Candidatus Dojkabacteria bacterium]